MTTYRDTALKFIEIEEQPRDLYFSIKYELANFLLQDPHFICDLAVEYKINPILNEFVTVHNEYMPDELPVTPIYGSHFLIKEQLELVMIKMPPAVNCNEARFMALAQNWKKNALRCLL